MDATLFRHSPFICTVGKVESPVVSGIANDRLKESILCNPSLFGHSQNNVPFCHSVLRPLQSVSFRPRQARGAARWWNGEPC